MSKLRLDPESLRVKSFETASVSDRSRGTVHGHSQTTATDYWTTLCKPPQLDGPDGDPQPIDPNQNYGLPEVE